VADEEERNRGTLLRKAVESGPGRGPTGRGVIWMRPWWLRSSCLGRAWDRREGRCRARGVDASVSLACCWLCLASIAAGTSPTARCCRPSSLGHTGRPIGTRQQQNSRQKQRRELVNRRASGQKNSLPACKAVPGQDKRTAQSSCCRSHGGGGVACNGGHPRPPSPRLPKMQLAQLSPGDLSTVAGSWRRGSVVSMHNVSPWPWRHLVGNGHEPDLRARLRD